MTSEVVLNCQRCGDEYTRHPSQAEGSKFCSNKCRHGRSTAVPPSERVSYDDPMWRENRAKALERDNHTCQICGATSEGEELVVHHLRPVMQGGTHDLVNLDTLCRSCHSSVHSSGAIVAGDSNGALLLPKERELLSQGIPVDLPREEILQQFRADVELLAEHHPDLLQEIREIVCESTESEPTETTTDDTSNSRPRTGEK